MNTKALITEIESLKGSELSIAGESINAALDAALDVIRATLDGMAIVPAKVKGSPMDQNFESWQKLYGLAEDAMLKDKAEISRLKQRINKLEQRNASN